MRQCVRATRRGVALMTVLVCLLVIGAIGGALLHTMVAADRDLHLERDRLQVLWLLESGLERAEFSLAADRDYEGEQWTIEAPELGGRRGAVVQIDVQPHERDAAMRNVVVEATLGQGPHRVSDRVTRRVSFVAPEETP